LVTNNRELNMRIVYLEKSGTLSVIWPSPEWAGTIDDLAQKDVPTGLKYLIVEDNFIPTDRSFRDAWEIAESELTDGAGA
tara:strand:+ start:487 stop:726 length:240 start_codon:yes stop_codon:yes gene_type:complete